MTDISLITRYRRIKEGVSREYVKSLSINTDGVLIGFHAGINN